MCGILENELHSAKKTLQNIYDQNSICETHSNFETKFWCFGRAEMFGVNKSREEGQREERRTFFNVAKIQSIAHHSLSTVLHLAQLFYSLGVAMIISTVPFVKQHIFVDFWF